MITDIPNACDFEIHGIDYLNLAWGTVMKMLTYLDEFCELNGDIDKDMEVGFWEAAKREIAISLSLSAQGAEFLLKSRICKISPWLLITQDPSDFPKRSDIENIAFSKFRIIDAQDLLKVNNTFSNQRLSSEFSDIFESLRRTRNSLMHTVDKNLNLEIVTILETILLISEFLIGPKRWVKLRRDYIERDRYSNLNCDFDYYRLAKEFKLVTDILGAKSLLRHFGINKKQRKYACPNCSFSEPDAPFECFTAQLSPNTPDSESIYCFVCENFTQVKRIDCKYDNCKGNVYDSNLDICLSCMQNQQS